MPKISASHDASWKGRSVAAGEIVEVSEAEAVQLAAHGFREIEEASPDETDADNTDDLSRKELLKILRGKGAGNLLIKPTEELRRLARKVLAGQSITLEKKRPDDGDE